MQMQAMIDMQRQVAGPDINTRTPGIVFPKHACDCHAHVFGPQSKYPYVDHRKFTPHDASLAEYLAMLAALGVARGVLVQPSHYGTDNTALLDALKEAGGSMLRGIAVVDGLATHKELETLHRAGVRGLRINLRTSDQPAIDVISAAAERIAPLGWHLELCIKSSEFAYLERVLDSLKVNIVVDHIGQISAAAGVSGADFRALLRMAISGRCWIKISAPMRLSVQEYPYADVSPFIEALIREVPQQLIWGTDWPHPNIRQRMPNDADLADLLGVWVPDEKMRQRILVENPEKLYWFD